MKTIEELMDWLDDETLAARENVTENQRDTKTFGAGFDNGYLEALKSVSKFINE